MSLVALAMNGLLILLLGAALVMGLRLNSRLKAVRDGQVAFTGAVAALDAATARAQQGLAELRAATDETLELLGGRIVRAREATERLDAALARAADLPLQTPIRAEPMAAAPSQPSRPGASGPMGLQALLARLEAEPLAKPEPEAPQIARRPPTRPASVDDDLFVDGSPA